jgi:hypothetical protein
MKMETASSFEPFVTTNITTRCSKQENYNITFTTVETSNVMDDNFDCDVYYYAEPKIAYREMHPSASQNKIS